MLNKLVRRFFGPPQYVWRSKDHDIPVEYITVAGIIDGVVFAEVKYEGKHSFVPLSELHRV